MTWFCCHDNAVRRCNKKGKSTVRKLSAWWLYTGADLQEQDVSLDLVVLVCFSYLGVNTSHLVEWVVDSGSRIRGHRSYEGTFISVGYFIRTGATPANVHDVETWLHTTSKIAVGNSSMLVSQNDDLFRKAKMTHWLLWGKSSRCCIVTKGWPRASTGAILSSASISNIFFSRPTNSRRSAFSASKSLPSIFITKFTWKICQCQTFRSSLPTFKFWICIWGLKKEKKVIACETRKL